jgi:amino-acid N-acetyltransferase
METSPGDVTFRAAVSADVPRLAELIAAASLPPLFIEEYLGGFIAAERAGTVIACGGVEFYGESAVIRSVVVDPEAQGLGLGRRIAEQLMDKIREHGGADIYLVTADALPFWQHMGFSELSFDDWAEDPRACWQFQFVSQNLELLPGIHTMRCVL